MSRYRLNDGGVEIVEAHQSTFLVPDVTSSAWRNYLAWQAAGNVAEPVLPRPYAAPSGAIKKLWIVGAGGFGREVFSMSAGVRGAGMDWNVAGFLNDIPDALDGFTGYPPVGGGTDYEPQPDDIFFCAIGDSAGRAQVCWRLRARGAKFINLLHPSSLISATAKLGEGVIAEAFSAIGANARIGSFSFILGHANIAHDVVIGEYAQVSPYACLLGRAEVGEGSLIGAHAVVLPGVKVGRHVTVGAGAVVIKDVPDGATVFGVPATRLK
jgi:sugar O-acyltransferase (sialic acid O-acetyltransferase NeuD family)